MRGGAAGAKGRHLRAVGVAKGWRRAKGAGAGTELPSSESRQRRKKGTGRPRQRAPERTPRRTLQEDRKAVWTVLGSQVGMVQAARSDSSGFRSFRFSAQGQRGVRGKGGSGVGRGTGELLLLHRN